ncbi:MAG: hypothetical protein H6658_10185 [Ardenticatenaceae bacterium]|nr:hypothetical protein [Ardenticatenaceae bacterium]
MPYYQYRCNDCEHEFETRQRMSEDPLTDCPVCDGRIRRVVNSVGVVFKGSGFYVTDTRNGKSATIPSDNSKTADTNKTSENGTSESTKPEPAKAEPAKSSSESKTKEPVAAK